MQCAHPERGSAWNALVAGPVVANTWIHLAATYDGTNARFYTNGTLAAAARVAVQPNDTFPLRIGASATESAGGYWFPGRVDDVRVYRVALDAPGFEPRADSVDITARGAASLTWEMKAVAPKEPRPARPRRKGGGREDVNGIGGWPPESCWTRALRRLKCRDA